MFYAGYAERNALEAEASWEDRDIPRTIWRRLSATADAHGDRPAVTFQMFGQAKAPSKTMTWRQVRDDAARFANFLRSLGLGAEDRVAFLLPNCHEAVITYLGSMISGIVQPINPLLDVDQIAAMLRSTGAKVVVTLCPLPKSDIAQKAAAAVARAPGVAHVVEVDLIHYLTFPKSWIAPLMRPRVERAEARYHAWADCLADAPPDLGFEDPVYDRVVTNFHTGGTTGRPKIVQHRQEGLLYNGWLAERIAFGPEDAMICPLPMFHVFAAIVIMGTAMTTGAHVVLPTPQGYRGAGVFDNFWKLCERYGITFVITVPTAMSALMQRKVDADISKLRLAISGSSPLSADLYETFQDKAGLTICEGYGLTEATCLVSINPPDGERRVGSVGIPFPHSEVRIFRVGPEAAEECETDEIGEICVASPGVCAGGTYTDAEKNEGLYRAGRFLRTGDLGRFDADRYLWITGRLKEVIIRGGHNIDPGVIEEALMAHDEVAVAAAIGQPDAYAGELPCAYVELTAGATVTGAALAEFAADRIAERAARPKYVEILDELPTTAVGKVSKPDLKRRAIRRVFIQSLQEAGIDAEIVEVTETPDRGLSACLRQTGPVDADAVDRVLGAFTVPWHWAEDGAPD